MQKSRLKIPQEFVDEFDFKLARLLWLEYGRNDKERWKNYNAELQRKTEKRSRRAEEKRQYGLKHRHDIKHEAFSHYSASGDIKCARCGFDDTRALTLYGVKGDAKQEEQEAVHGGWNLYDWLKKHNWPKGYRLLCENCVFIESGRGSLYPLKAETFVRYAPLENEQIRYTCPKCRFVILVPHTVKCPKCATPLLGQVQCVRCKFSDIRALSLDHVEGGGRKHMEALGVKKASEFYQWLKDHHYPQKPRLQVLCMNCQFIKANENAEW